VNAFISSRALIARRIAADLELRRRAGALAAKGGRAARTVGVPDRILIAAGKRLRRRVPWDLNGDLAVIRASHEVFDIDWYLNHSPDVREARMDPVRHYLLYGAAQRRSPHPLFDTGRYLDANPDVAASGVNPLVHYLVFGGREGCDPHWLFDTAWYLATYPDVAGAGLNPLVHFLRTGASEGRSPNPLFDTAWYVSRYPQVATSGFNPLVHYLFFGGFQGLQPNPWFDSAMYLAENRDVAAIGENPLMHFVSSGAREGRRPGPLFDSAWYVAEHPEVNDEIPLRHFCAVGRMAGYAPNRLARRAGEWSYRPARGEVPWVNPVDFVVDDALAAEPRLNVLIPSLGLRHMSGGPNTVLQFVARLAAIGERTRLISTEQGIDHGSDEEELWRHIARLTGLARHHKNLEIVDGSKPSAPVAIGEHDVFMGTAFWTVLAIKAALPLVRPQRFIYLIQDFEPGFFAASSQYALALETYGLDHFPIVNTQILFDFLVANRVGRFADPDHVIDAVVFQPSVDRFHFYVDIHPRSRRRLLFYARPTAGLRNMFELGVAALRLAHQRGVFADDEWEFVGMGDRFEAVALSGEAVLHQAPWLSFDGYAEQMRQSDVLLSLMLAPHPSYPPLEMAACGGLVVTNSYDVKTAERLEQLSTNIISAEPTIEAIADALAEAVRRLADTEDRRVGSNIALPEDWDDAVLPLVPRIRQAIKEIRSGPSRLDLAFRTEPHGRYDEFRLERRKERAVQYDHALVPGLLSLITPVWNTDQDYLAALARSVFEQDGGTAFEWVVLDNGSDDSATLSQLAAIAAHPAVRFIRSDVNLGIIGGMRACREAATGRYLVHVDHDDLLAPDALRVITAALLANDEPPLFYSDEDKLLRDVFFEPYFKPEWDPVLLSNSCYVAHLCGVRNDVAKELGAYDDPATEASPDWDLFVRAHLAGHEPLHVPEVLYSWRLHPGSTAGDSSAKSSVRSTHVAVLQKLITGKGLADRFELVSNPRSPASLDWWIRRRRDVPVPSISSIVIGEDVPVDAPIGAVGALARAAADRGDLLHVRWVAAEPIDDEWRWEAAGLMELFPDVVVVGGPVEQNGRLVAAGSVFGFGDGCGSPDVGRGVAEHGWMATLPKQRTVSAVSAQHLVANADFVAAAVLQMPADVPVADLGAWLGAVAARARRRVVYSPHVGAITSNDLSSRVTAAQRAMFNRANADLLPDDRVLSPVASLDRLGDVVPVAPSVRAEHIAGLIAPPEPALPTYPQWLERRIAAREDWYAVPDDPPGVSVITPVYEGSETGLLEELASALDQQRVPFREWIIATDGAVRVDLAERLAAMSAADARVRVLHGPRRGILATMRAAFEASSSDYITPIDADDLITPDALAILASAIAAAGRPALVYSDEDIVDTGGVRDPFLRPDWDPVLHASGSYIWHLIAYRRDVGVDVGLYVDDGANWCHDWDTVDRIAAAGHRPVHVPEVLYHWRHHARSSSNTADPTTGSQQSVRHVMERMIERGPHAERYGVELFPIDRGASEWSIVRRPVDPTPTALLVTTDRPEPVSSFLRSVARTCPTPFTSVRIVALDAGPWASALANTLGQLDVPLVVVASDAVDLLRVDWYWAAVGILERHPEVAVVTGRIVDVHGHVVAGGEVGDPESGALVRPLAGRSLADPGPYAFALKPHTVSAVTTRLFVAERAALLDALVQSPADGVALADHLDSAGRTVAYTPLLEARISSPDAPLDGAPANRAIRGLAGF
jgi:glycosyltransferase involved in cell wall biosynthesis